MANYTGGAGDDTQVGSADDDSFDYSQGGHDTLFGGDGMDSFNMGAALDSLDVLDGGSGGDADFDDVSIVGDYSAGLTITTSMFVDIEAFGIGAGAYRLTLAAGLGEVGQRLVVGFQAGASGLLDASAMTNGVDVTINDGATVRVIGGAGDDVFGFDGSSRGNVIVGGAGDDRLDMNSATPFKAAGHSFTGIETVRMLFNQPLTLADGNLAAGQTLSVIGWSVHEMTVDGHKETDGHYHMTGDLQADRLTGGHLGDTIEGADSSDTLTGGGGADQLTGGTGADVFVYRLVGDSKIGAADLIGDLEAGDSIDLSAIDADKHQAGLQHFVQVEAFDGHAGQVMLVYDAGADVTRLLADVNGDGEAELEIDITGDHHDFAGLVL